MLKERKEEGEWRNRYGFSRHRRGKGALCRVKKAFSVLQHQKDLLKERVEREEETYGHAVDAADIMDMWKEVLCERFVELKRLAKICELQEDNVKAMESIQKKLEVWGDGKKRSRMQGDIMNDIGRKSKEPQRRTAMSMAEEKLKAHLTWQDFDEGLHVCCFDKERLKQLVDDPPNNHGFAHPSPQHVLIPWL